MEESNYNNLRNKLTNLLTKNVLTEEEIKWLKDYADNTKGEELQTLLHEQIKLSEQNEGNEKPYDPAQLLQLIRKKSGIPDSNGNNKYVSFWKWGLAAASIILIFGISAYFGFDEHHQQNFTKIEKASTQQTSQDIHPGTNKAILLLDDGTNLLLDSAANGIIAQEGNVEVVKSGEKINYQSSGSNNTEKKAYNTILTPRGGQYSVVLSDGTKVWLNAASSIRFPISFGTMERVVEVTGEVYFEVAPLSRPGSGERTPFIVRINTTSGNGGEVSVLGTHFNIMAYPDENDVRTTLLEGSVVYNNSGKSRILKPGQQSVFSPQDGLTVKEDVKVNDVIAWKNGNFHFEGSSIESVLRQISRWYDAEVVFNRKVNDKFYADIPMNTMLSDALKALELTGQVQFKIANGTIFVN